MLDDGDIWRMLQDEVTISSHEAFDVRPEQCRSAWAIPVLGAAASLSRAQVFQKRRPRWCIAQHEKLRFESVAACQIGQNAAHVLVARVAVERA
jgi:hypothetical protein